MMNFLWDEVLIIFRNILFLIFVVIVSFFIENLFHLIHRILLNTYKTSGVEDQNIMLYE